MSDDAYQKARDEIFDYERSRGYSRAQARDFADGAMWGAGWMAAIIGMGQAIKDGHCHYGDTWASCRGQCENDE